MTKSMTDFYLQAVVLMDNVVFRWINGRLEGMVAIEEFRGEVHMVITSVTMIPLPMSNLESVARQWQDAKEKLCRKLLPIVVKRIEDACMEEILT